MDFKIINFYQELYSIYRNGEYFGDVANVYEFNDLRIQIAKAQNSEFQVEFEGKMYDILPNGDFAWPNGFYDTHQHQLNELFKIQRTVRQQKESIFKEDSKFNIL